VHPELFERREPVEELAVVDIGPIELVSFSKEVEPVRRRLSLGGFEKRGISVSVPLTDV